MLRDRLPQSVALIGVSFADRKLFFFLVLFDRTHPPPTNQPTHARSVKMALQELTYQDVAEHNTKKDLYVVIHDKVYDITKFVDEHP